MKLLELRVPPPVVGLLVAIAMYAVASVLKPVTWMFVDASFWAVPLSLCCVGIGIGFDVLGLWDFRRHKTTINPLSPEKTSALVTSGVYQLTRNPMYVGMALVLLGWWVYLMCWPLVLGPVLFVAYITRFQIQPEERILLQRFGDEFRDYSQQVRRWL